MKDIKGFEGIYAITSCGRVWSYRNEMFLKPKITKDGYLRVKLCKNGKMKHIGVHRLVAEAYLPNPNNLPQVNHKDENKKNNCLQNLEWCDASYNINYGTCVKRRSAKRKKPILQFDLEGNFIREWNSAVDVGKRERANIKECLRGRTKTAYNYIWKYKE